MSEPEADPTAAPPTVGEDPNAPATDPASAAAPPSRRAALMRSGLIVGVLVLVFLVILPRYIDYGEVVAAFQALTLNQIVIMTVLGLLVLARQRPRLLRADPRTSRSSAARRRG